MIGWRQKRAPVTTVADLYREFNGYHTDALRSDPRSEAYRSALGQMEALVDDVRGLEGA